MGKLKWVAKASAFRARTSNFTKSVSFPSAFRQLSVSFPSAFRVTRFRLPVSGPLKVTAVQLVAAALKADDAGLLRRLLACWRVHAALWRRMGAGRGRPAAPSEGPRAAWDLDFDASRQLRAAWDLWLCSLRVEEARPPASQAGLGDEESGPRGQELDELLEEQARFRRLGARRNTAPAASLRRAAPRRARALVVIRSGLRGPLASPPLGGPPGSLVAAGARAVKSTALLLGRWRARLSSCLSSWRAQAYN